MSLPNVNHVLRPRSISERNNRPLLNSKAGLAATLSETPCSRKKSLGKHSFSSTAHSSFRRPLYEKPLRRPNLDQALMSLVSETYQKLTDHFVYFSLNPLSQLQHNDGTTVGGDGHGNEDSFKNNLLGARRTLKTLYKQLYLLEHLLDNSAPPTEVTHLPLVLLEKKTQKRSTNSMPLPTMEENECSISGSLPDEISTPPSFHCLPLSSTLLLSTSNSAVCLPDITSCSNPPYSSVSDFGRGGKSTLQDPPSRLKPLESNADEMRTESVVMGKHRELPPIENSLGEFNAKADTQIKLNSPNSCYCPKSTGPIPPFPIVSNLESGVYTLELYEMGGFDIGIPLDQLNVAVIDYRMVYANREYILKPLSSQTFPNDSPVISSGSCNTLNIFRTPPLNFTLTNDHQLAVFVLLVKHSRRLVCWTIVCALNTGVWSESLRSPPYNVKDALKYGGNLLQGTSISGRIESLSSTQISEHSISKLISGSNLPALVPQEPLTENSMRGENDGLQEEDTDESDCDDADSLEDENTESDSLPSLEPPTSWKDKDSKHRGDVIGMSDEDESAVVNGSTPPPLECSLLSSPNKESDDDDSNKEETEEDTITLVSESNGFPTHPTSTLGHSASSLSGSLSLAEDANNSSTTKQKKFKKIYRCMHMQLQPVIDPEGRLVVPKDYKRNDGPASLVDLSPFDTPAVSQPGVWALLKGIPPDNVENTTKKQSPSQRPIDGKVQLCIDVVFGAPLNSKCARVLVYVMNAIEPGSGDLIYPLNDPYGFIREPDLIAYQTYTSSILNPEFTSSLSVVGGNNTCAVVIVEYITDEENFPIVLGHCCLPINKSSCNGNFLCRIQMGDPRRSMERNLSDTRPKEEIEEEQVNALQSHTQAQLESSIDAQALRDLLPAAPLSRAECIPMGFMAWRMNSDNTAGPYDLMPNQLPPSKQEICVLMSRRNYEPVAPVDLGVKTKNFVDEAFSGCARLLNDRLSHISLFNPKRGVFLHVECLRGFGMGKTSVHVVTINLLEKYGAQGSSGGTETNEQRWRHLYCTKPAHPLSDIGILDFADPPFILSDTAYHPCSLAFFTVLRVSFPALNKSGRNLASKDGHKGSSSATEESPIIEEVGWTANRIFLDQPGIVRQGRFVLPLLKMSNLKKVIEKMKNDSFNEIYLKFIQDRNSAFVTPNATLTVAQGDPACAVQILSDLPGRPHPHQLLTPFSLRNAFPISTNEGAIGYSLHKAYESTFRIDEQLLRKKVCRVVNEYLKQKIENE